MTTPPTAATSPDAFDEGYVDDVAIEHCKRAGLTIGTDASQNVRHGFVEGARWEHMRKLTSDPIVVALVQACERNPSSGSCIEALKAYREALEGGENENRKL